MTEYLQGKPVPELPPNPPSTAAPNIIELNIFGQVCPSCLLITLKTVNTHSAALREKAVEVVILTDDRQATSTIPEAVSRMGYQCAVDSTERGYRIRIFAAA